MESILHTTSGLRCRVLLSRHQQLSKIGINYVNTQLFQSSSQEVEDSLHKIVDQSSEQRVVERSRLSANPAVEVFKQFI